MSFCFLYNVVSENYSVQNSPWGGGGSIASSRSILSVVFIYCIIDPELQNTDKYYYAE